MPNSKRTFSLKRDVQLTKIYHLIKYVILSHLRFPKAKRNLSEFYGHQQFPSPAHYKHENYKKNKNSPKFSFGKEQKCFFRSIKKVQISQKDTQKNLQFRTQTKFQVAKSYRNDTESTKDIVGVHSCHYQREYIKMKNLVRFSQQKWQSNIYQTPGPFQYHVQPDKNLTLYGTFYKEKRMPMKLQQIPGVGGYSIELYSPRHSPHARFTAQNGRVKFHKTAQVPGPGSYTSCLVEKYKSHSRSTSISFCKQKRPFQTPQKLTPGPGDYEVQEKKSISPSSIRVTRYSKQLSKFQQTMPLYKPNLDLTIEKSRTSRFKKRDEQKIQQSPKLHCVN